MAHEGSPALEGDAGRAAGGDGAAHKLWQPYLEAALGFRNHWYPAFFGNQLAEGQCRGQEMLGERLLFKRIDGKVYAIEDRCAQPGVQHSKRPEYVTPKQYD